MWGVLSISYIGGGGKCNGKSKKKERKKNHRAKKCESCCLHGKETHPSSAREV
jgi:hypothetical protein